MVPAYIFNIYTFLISFSHWKPTNILWLTGWFLTILKVIVHVLLRQNRLPWQPYNRPPLTFYCIILFSFSLLHLSPSEMTLFTCLFFFVSCLPHQNVSSMREGTLHVLSTTYPVPKMVPGKSNHLLNECWVMYALFFLQLIQIS